MENISPKTVSKSSTSKDNDTVEAIVKPPPKEGIMVEEYDKTFFKEAYIGCMSVQTNEHIAVLNKLAQ